jgi:flagellar motor switch protein FliM
METLTPTSSTQPQRVLAPGDMKSEVMACDFRTVGGIDKARLAPLVSAIEGFAGPFSDALRDRLGLTAETALRPSEQMLCRKFLDKAGSSYLVSLKIGSHGDIALLQIDSMLLFPIVDRLLGGSGSPSELSREPTDIEDQIAKEFVRLICQQLQTTWQAFGVSVSLGARQSPAMLQRLFSGSDNGMVFSFSTNMQTAGGDFQLLLPVASLGSFLAEGTATAEFSRKGTMSARFAGKILSTTFGLELALPGCKVPAADLLNLAVGKVLPLGLSVRTHAILKIEGHSSFEAVPVRTGQHRGAQILERVSQAQAETENTKYENSN